jgi:lipid-A-disaccharide synthase
MFVILPFEKEFYERYGVKVDFVGHPLLDELKGLENKPPSADKVIALLPGSRKQEISYLLPEYLKVIPEFPEYKFVITGLSQIGEDFYKSIIGNSRCELVMDKTYGTLKESTAAIVTSGTATLETALHNVPEVICYKGSWISYYIAKQLIKGISYICIVNLICDERVVEELIQADVNKDRLVLELRKLLTPEGRTSMLDGYERLRHKLDDSGASERTATLMLQYLKEG